jgi:hypothetical protein
MSEFKVLVYSADCLWVQAVETRPTVVCKYNINDFMRLVDGTAYTPNPNKLDVHNCMSMLMQLVRDNPRKLFGEQFVDLGWTTNGYGQLKRLQVDGKEVELRPFLDKIHALLTSMEGTYSVTNGNIL